MLLNLHNNVHKNIATVENFSHSLKSCSVFEIGRILENAPLDEVFRIPQPQFSSLRVQPPSAVRAEEVGRTFEERGNCPEEQRPQMLAKRERVSKVVTHTLKVYLPIRAKPKLFYRSSLCGGSLHCSPIKAT